MPANNFLNNYKNSIDANLMNAASMRPGDLKSKKIVTYSKPFDIKPKNIDFNIKKDIPQSILKQENPITKVPVQSVVLPPTNPVISSINEAKATKENFVEIYKDDDIPSFEDNEQIQNQENIKEKSLIKTEEVIIPEEPLDSFIEIVEPIEDIIFSEHVNDNANIQNEPFTIVENLVDEISNFEETALTEVVEPPQIVIQDDNKEDVLSFSNDFSAIEISNTPNLQSIEEIKETEIVNNIEEHNTFSEIEELNHELESVKSEISIDNSLNALSVHSFTDWEKDAIEIQQLEEASESSNQETIIADSYSILEEIPQSVIQEIEARNKNIKLDALFEIDEEDSLEEQPPEVLKISEGILPKRENKTEIKSSTPVIPSVVTVENKVEEQVSKKNTSSETKTTKVTPSVISSIQNKPKNSQAVAKIVNPVVKKPNTTINKNKLPIKSVPKKVVKKETNFFIEQTDKVKKVIVSLTKMVKEMIDEKFNQKNKNKKLSTKYIPQWSEEKIEKPKFSIQKKATIYEEVKTVSQQKLNEIIVKKKKLEKIKELCSWNASSISMLMEAYLLEPFQEKKTVSITSNHLKKIGLSGEAEDYYFEPENVENEREYSQREIEDAQEYSYFNPIAARISENRAQMERKEREDKIANYRKSLDIYSDDEASIYQKAIADFLKDNKEFLDEVNKDEYLNQLEELQED